MNEGVLLRKADCRRRGAPLRTVSPWLYTPASFSPDMALDMDPANYSWQLLDTMAYTLIMYVTVMLAYNWIVAKLAQDSQHEAPGGFGRLPPKDGSAIARSCSRLMSTTQLVLARNSAEHVTQQIRESRRLVQYKLLQRRLLISTDAAGAPPAPPGAGQLQLGSPLVPYIDACLDMLGPQLLLAAPEGDLVDDVVSKVAIKLALEEIQLLAETAREANQAQQGPAAPGVTQSNAL